MIDQGKLTLTGEQSSRIWKECPEGVSRIASPLEPTPVFCSYWNLAAERQSILHKRVSKQDPPWTDDSILRNHRFTNSYRVSDRSTQYLIKEVLYNNDWSLEDTFFRCILYKTFNKPETWNYIRNSFGEPTWGGVSTAELDLFLSSLMERNIRLYSSAYIMPSGGKIFPRKHSFHLALIDKMMNDHLPIKISRTKSLEEAYVLLLSYESIGPFLAFQYAIDLNYSTILNFDESDFVVAGPGAISGINKCFQNSDKFSPEEIIHLVTEKQESYFDALKIDFQKLKNRPLKPIDCQNLFCETDKYARIAYPTSVGIGGRTRIKRKYSDPRPVDDVMLPPKWRLS